MPDSSQQKDPPKPVSSMIIDLPESAPIAIGSSHDRQVNNQSQSSSSHQTNSNPQHSNIHQLPISHSSVTSPSSSTVSSPNYGPCSPPTKPTFMSFISKLRPRPHGMSPREEYPSSPDPSSLQSPTSPSSATNPSYFPQLPQASLASPPAASHFSLDSLSASSSPPVSSTSQFLSPQPLPTRPLMPHMSHSSSAIATRRSVASSPGNSPQEPSLNNPQFQQQYKILLQQHQLQQSQQNTEGQIFGVPLETSIKYAQSNMIYEDKEGNEHVYGQIPIIVAKCAYFLKNNAADVEGIFRVSGSSRRIKDLQAIFSSPPTYGKNLDWTGFNVHDAANVLRRYLNNLPEPIIPLEFYDKFREPLLASPLIVEHLKGNEAISATNKTVISTTVKSKAPEDAESSQTENTNNSKPQESNVIPEALETEIQKAIVEYKDLIETLPALNRQLLLYIFDLLAFFASKSQKNLMPAVNLAAIFQPSILSHPCHNMEPNAYHLSRAISQFLIEHFRAIQPKLNWSAKSAASSDSVPEINIRHHVRRHSKSMSSVSMPSNITSILNNASKKEEPAKQKNSMLSVSSSPTPSESNGIISSIKRASSITRRRKASPASSNNSSKPSSPIVLPKNVPTSGVRKVSEPESLKLENPKPQFPKVPVLMTTTASTTSITTLSNPATVDVSSPSMSTCAINNGAGVSSVVSSPRFIGSSVSGSSSEGEGDSEYPPETSNNGASNGNPNPISHITTSTSKTSNDDGKKQKSRFRGHRRKISESLSQMSSLLTRRSLSPLHRSEEDRKNNLSSLESRLEMNNASSRSIASVVSSLSMGSNGGGNNQSLDTALASANHQSGMSLGLAGMRHRHDSVDSMANPQALSSTESSVDDYFEEDGDANIRPAVGENSQVPLSLSKQQRVSKWRRSLMAINIPVGNGSSGYSESTTPALDETVLSPTSAIAFSNGYFPTVKDYPLTGQDASSPALGSSPSNRQSWIRAPFKSRSRNNSGTAIDGIKEDAKDLKFDSVRSSKHSSRSSSVNMIKHGKEEKPVSTPPVTKSMIIDDHITPALINNNSSNVNNTHALGTSDNTKTTIAHTTDTPDDQTYTQSSASRHDQDGLVENVLDKDKSDKDTELKTILEKPEKETQLAQEDSSNKTDAVLEANEFSDEATPREEKDLSKLGDVANTVETDNGDLEKDGGIKPLKSSKTLTLSDTDLSKPKSEASLMVKKDVNATAGGGIATASETRATPLDSLDPNFDTKTIKQGSFESLKTAEALETLSLSDQKAKPTSLAEKEKENQEEEKEGKAVATVTATGTVENANKEMENNNENQDALSSVNSSSSCLDSSNSSSLNVSTSSSTATTS